jgi:hypothetical protein
MEVYRASEENGVQNKKLFEKKLDIPVLAVGGDFFFGEVPRKQMEQVGPDGILLMTGRDECAGSGHPIRTQYCPGEARGACGCIRQVLGRA